VPGPTVTGITAIASTASTATSMVQDYCLALVMRYVHQRVSEKACQWR
jgi:hypothetical protein